MKRPLADVKVLELARVLAGPWAGQLLADLGADVIKVERPGSGDETRAWGPPFVSGPDGVEGDAAYFHATNRGKRSVTADLGTEEGRDLVRRLARRCDVLIENFKCGALVKFGLDHASLRAANPRLIYCSITGFGQSGPYAHRAGYDFIIQGLSGLMDVTGMPDGPPLKGGVASADVFTGVYAVVAVLAALRERDATGCGTYIDMSLLDVQMSVLANQALNFLVSGRAPQRLGNAHPNLAPYEVFPAQGGDLIIAVGNDAQFQRLCAVLGSDALAGTARFATNAARVANRVELSALIAAQTSGRQRDGLITDLEAAGVPGGPINSIAQAFADPQVRARGVRVDLPAENLPGGTLPAVRAPIVFDGVASVAMRRSPTLGEHTLEVLNELGAEVPPPNHQGGNS
jgi:crotonobetainyl-CoA:carnitine CoA-transferase CaiB-like acyl-CoA transferase